MIDFCKGLVNTGDWTKVRAVMERAATQEITVGFLGGSITQGSLSSTPETCYAYLVYRWWAERFPKVRYVNAGIGATTSQFAAARADEDLLAYKPDMVFVEFSVNDAGNAHFQETYEGLIRKLLKAGTAVILIHNICYDTGVSAEDVHVEIGRHYQLPCVSIRTTVYPEVVSGAIPNRDITPDDLHPNDAGHALLARLVTTLLDQIAVSPVQEVSALQLPAPLTANAYERSTRYRNRDIAPEMQGFTPDPTPQKDIREIFRLGYTAKNVGDRIVFRVNGSGLAVQYRKSVRKPAPIAVAIVDGQEDQAIILDANFQETWGDCLYLQDLLVHGENRMHTVEIRITQASSEDAVPFYLVSVIGSEQE